jgi:chromosomal replication initiator protein
VSATSSADILCAQIAERLADRVGPRKYGMWFERSAELDFEHDAKRLLVTVPNRFVADWISRNFDQQLRQAAHDAVGQRVDLSVRISPDRFAGEAPAPVAPPPPTPRRRVSAGPSLKHSLDDFVVGPSNELAFATAGRIVEDEFAAVNPLFIHGGCGLGKTHLLQGICRSMAKRHPGAKVMYLTAEQFTNDYLTALRTGKLNQFRGKIRGLDLLAVDDVRFIADKQRTQQEFLHSFDAIELGGSRVVLASDCHPRLIKQFSEALISRCIRGMVVQIRPPDRDTRLRIVAALARRRRLVLDDAVAQAVVDRCRESIREIEGTLTKVHALASMTSRGGENSRGGFITVSRATVDHLFATDFAAVRLRAVSFADIVRAVCQQMHVTRDEALGSSRHRHIVIARAMIIRLAREKTNMSFPEIATAMNRPSHSTIITAHQRIEKQIAAAHPFILPASGEQITVSELHERVKDALARG